MWYLHTINAIISFFGKGWRTPIIHDAQCTLIEITKCPPFFRKLWAFKATILVWSGWATSANITSTMPRERQIMTIKKHHLYIQKWHQSQHFFHLDKRLIRPFKDLWQLCQRRSTPFILWYFTDLFFKRITNCQNHFFPFEKLTISLHLPT